MCRFGIEWVWISHYTKKVINMFIFYLVLCFNPVGLRKAKIVHNFGLSECNRVKVIILLLH